MGRPRVLLAVLLVSAVVLAACIQRVDDDGSGDLRAPDVDPDWYLHAVMHGGDHDHTDPEQHRDLTTPNFEIVGWDPLVSGHYGTTPHGLHCGDAKATEDGRRLAAIESRSDVGFVLVDITDPTEPHLVGELVMRATYVYDLAVVPDGRHVVLSTSDVRPDGLLPDLPLHALHGAASTPTASGPAGEGTLAHGAGPDLVWRPACGAEVEVHLPGTGSGSSEDPLPRPVSLVLVDVSDPEGFRVVDQRPLSGLGHSTYSTHVDGRTWVVTTNWGMYEATGTFQFYQLLETPAGTFLDHLSTYTVTVDDPDNATRGMGHNDAWIATHPVTGQTLAYLAAWNAGLVILDMQEPRLPRLVGQWSDHVPGVPGTGQVHSAHPLPDVWPDGRHYTAIGPEWVARPSEDLSTGVAYFLDTTDPATPFAVAAWTLPVELDWQERLLFSTHYLTVWEKTLFVSMYHGGIWAIDLSQVSSEAFTLPPAVGVFLPDRQSPAPPETPHRWAPTLQEVFSFDDGTLATFEGNSGVYTFRFHPDVPVPPAPVWPLDPPAAPHAPVP